MMNSVVKADKRILV